MKKRRNETGIILLLILAMITVMAMFTGCGGNEDALNEVGVTSEGGGDEGESLSEDADASENGNDSADDMTAGADGEAAGEAEEPETSDPSVQQYSAVEEWIAAVNASEFTVGVWNEETGKGEIFSMGETVPVRIGDNFVIMGFSLPKSADQSLCTFIHLISEDVNDMKYLVYEIIKPLREENEGEFIFTDQEENSYTVKLQYIESEEDTSCNLFDFADSSDREQLCFLIADYDHILRPDGILEDGDSYTLSEYEELWLYIPKEVSNISTDDETVWILDYYNNIKSVGITLTGSNIEIPVTVEYTDGTSEEITIYITNEW